MTASDGFEFPAAWDADGPKAFHLLSLSTQQELRGRVREAVRQHQVVPYYQPVVSLNTETAVGVEALARWTLPTSRIIGPDHFIPAAESGGFIGDLFFQILRQMCADVVKWDPSIRVAVNVSPNQFRDPFLANKILSVLDGTGLSAERLEIEVTEGNPLADWTRTARTINSLKAEGVRFALDDFGTGYANLGQLNGLPFDNVKIDRSFVTTLMERRESRTIVKSIISLCRDLEKTSIAEGVETGAQAEWLHDNGCDLAQGHHFSYPLPADAVDELFRVGDENVYGLA